MKDIVQKVKAAVDKLPFAGMARKVPALGKVAGYANYAACALAVLLVFGVALVSCGGGNKKTAASASGGTTAASVSSGSGAGAAAEDAKALLASAKDKASSTAKKAADTAKGATDTALAEAVKLAASNPNAFDSAIKKLVEADPKAAGDAVARLAKDAKPLAEKCFRYELTDDGSGVRILGLSDEGQKDTSPVLAFPATIEGMPVKELKGDSFKSGPIAVVVPEGVEKMSEVKFGGYADIIVYASLPSSLKEAVGQDGIAGRFPLFGEDLCRVDIPSDCKLQEVSEKLFYQAKITSVAIPASVKKIGKDAFHYCKNLTSVEIPEGVTEIDSRAFWDCHALEKVTLPSTIKSIGQAAFKDCSALTEVVIPEGVTIKFGSNSVFEGTHLNLKSQAAVKAAGYAGRF